MAEESTLVECVNDLRKILEEPPGGFYVKLRGAASLRLGIHRLEPNRIHVGVPGGLHLEPVVEGFVVAPNRSGIYRLTGRVDGEPERRDVYDIAPVEVDLSSIVFDKQRAFSRCLFDETVYADFRPVGHHESFRTLVLDFSAGGLKIRTTREMQVGDRFDVTFAPRIGEETRRFEFRAEVLAERGTVDDAREGLVRFYALWILCPEGESGPDLRALEALQGGITMFCNDHRERRVRLD